MTPTASSTPTTLSSLVALPEHLDSYNFAGVKPIIKRMVDRHAALLKQGRREAAQEQHAVVLALRNEWAGHSTLRCKQFDEWYDKCAVAFL